MQDINIREIALEVIRAADNVTQIDLITSRFVNFTIAGDYEVTHFVPDKMPSTGLGSRWPKNWLYQLGYVVPM